MPTKNTTKNTTKKPHVRPISPIKGRPLKRPSTLKTETPHVRPISPIKGRPLKRPSQLNTLPKKKTPSPSTPTNTSPPHIENANRLPEEDKPNPSIANLNFPNRDQRKAVAMKHYLPKSENWENHRYLQNKNLLLSLQNDASNIAENNDYKLVVANHTVIQDPIKKIQEIKKYDKYNANKKKEDGLEVIFGGKTKKNKNNKKNTKKTKKTKNTKNTKKTKKTNKK